MERTFEGESRGRPDRADTLVGCWTGDEGRRGIQFEALCFAPEGTLEVHIVTVCVRGYCPSVRASGVYRTVAPGRVSLTLDGFAQEFVVSVDDGCLTLCDTITGTSKRYTRR